jgi:hypothetical protein
MAKEKKLTVKGVFGDDLKLIKKNTENLSALYLLIIYNRKNTKVKSYTLSIYEYLLYKNYTEIDDKYLINNLKNHYKYLIEEDINLLTTCKSLYEKYSMKEFDIKFLSSEAFSYLSLPVDVFIRGKLQDLSVSFFDPKKFPKTIELISLLDPAIVEYQIESLSETSPKLFEKMISNEIFSLYYWLPRLLATQRERNKYQFFYLTDCLDENKLNSLFHVDFLKSNERAFYKGLTLELFQAEINNIFQNRRLE